jgi:hypothetical protein
MARGATVGQVPMLQFKLCVILVEGTMAKDLIVGSAGLQDFAGSISSFLSARGLEVGLAIWLERPDTIAEISCLNGATVMEFLRHAVQLEGYADEDAGFAAGAYGKLKGKNFPWWDNSLWLPLEFDDPGRLDDDATFVGSCQTLIAELDELKRISPLQLGDVVSEYSDMRADFLKFVRSDTVLDLRAEDCVRWIWRALRDGAELAIAHNAALWAGPD